MEDSSFQDGSILSHTTKSSDLLRELMRSGKIDLLHSTLFDQSPPPLPEDFDFGKVEGMMLGLAIGDSLGNVCESRNPSQRRMLYGEIRDYLPNRNADNRSVGLPSDDTQLAFWTLERMIEDGGFIPENIAETFADGRRIFGCGSAMRRFLANYQSGKYEWFEGGARSAGNGALMRIAPMLIPHLKNPSPELWAETALAAMITHNDTGSTAACISFINIFRQVLEMKVAPDPEWWLNTYVQTARELELNAAYSPRGGEFRNYSGPIWRFVEEKVADAYRNKLSTLEACNSWYSGAYLLETIPCVIYILMQHGHDPEEAIVRAVNDTRDGDTVAAILGAAVGALHGKERLPKRLTS